MRDPSTPLCVARAMPAVAMPAALLAAALAACAQVDVACEPPGSAVRDARAAGCVVVRDGALLMVRTEGGWSIPGGYVERGESSAEAAVRETREEAGVEAAAHEPFCAVAAKRFVAHRCTLAPGAGAPRPDRVESFEAKWMSRAALRALPASALRFPPQRAAYLRALDAHGPTAPPR